ncbi:MAG: triose-phosphate isomerase [Candidatus Cloacimonetes bacterium]|nr:triose-phosphate isomerase [Candidatus Cloacimonadota bacterium]
MRKTIIAGNWKMNMLFTEVEDFLYELSDNLETKKLGSVDVIVCPPSVYLELTSDIANDSNFFIGAQNVNDNASGAYTGEISAAMLRSMDIPYCIIGHSERRKYYVESDAVINAKLKKLHENEMIPIFCIGETLEQREQNITKDIILSQLNGGLKDVSIDDNVIIAYEPVWAIGTGKTATPEQAQEIHSLIRKWLEENYSKEISENTSILYGGSMKPENVKELLGQPDIDGGLIGGAALDVSKFSQMIETAVEL